jgi:hypothetical protein
MENSKTDKLYNFTLDRDTPEWTRAWQSLSGHELNRGLNDPFVAMNKGSEWQYMSSSSSEIKGGTVYHQFRHRQHPKSQKREIINI